MHFFENIKNEFDFFLRKNITFSFKNYKEIPHNFNIENQLSSNLSKIYDLSFFKNLNTRNFLENIYFLNIFQKYFSKKQSPNVSILDIGSKNWSYVRSEYLFFKSFCKNIHLDGIEIDANRLNKNFYSRAEIAKFYINDLSNTTYITGDFLEQNQNYDYIIWILPFITEYPLIKWGLPLKYFKPKEMLAHAYNMLNKNGEMLIINQGIKEADIQNNLLKSMDIPIDLSFQKIDDDLKLFKNERYCFKIIKQ